MPLSQPSPDRLIFSSQRRSNLAHRLAQTMYGIGILAIVGEVACCLYLFGWIFGRFLSHELAIYRVKPLENISYLAAFLLLDLFFLMITVWLCYFLKLTLKNEFYNWNLEIKLADKERNQFGEVSLARTNIFGQKKPIKVPSNRVTDIRIVYAEAAPLYYGVKIFLITNLKIEPIVIGTFFCKSSKARAITMLNLAVVEVERIRAFLNLPSKPSYFVAGKGDFTSSFVTDSWSEQKVLTDTPDIFRFVSRLAYFRSKVWTFDLNNRYTNLESYFLKFKYCQRIAIEDVKTICIKRESSQLHMLLIWKDWLLLLPNASKNLANLRQDRYSLLLVLKDGSSFKYPNNYLRVFSSSNLLSIEEYADRLRAHLNLPELVNEERADREPVALI